MRRVIHFPRSDVALVRLHLETGVRFAGEHPALLVLAVGGDGQVFIEVRLSFQDRELLDPLGCRRRGRGFGL